MHRLAFFATIWLFFYGISSAETRAAEEMDLTALSLADSYHFFVQVYYDRSEYELSVLDTAVDTIDIDTQLRFSLGAHQLTWGMGYRFTHDDLGENTPALQVEDKNGEYHLIGGFIQDELSWMCDRLRLTIGSKFEHNHFTGFELQPSRCETSEFKDEFPVIEDGDHRI